MGARGRDVARLREVPDEDRPARSRSSSSSRSSPDAVDRRLTRARPVRGVRHHEDGSTARGRATRSVCSRANADVIVGSNGVPALVTSPVRRHRNASRLDRDRPGVPRHRHTRACDRPGCRHDRDHARAERLPWRAGRSHHPDRDGDRRRGARDDRNSSGSRARPTRIRTTSTSWTVSPPTSTNSGLGTGASRRATPMAGPPGHHLGLGTGRHHDDARHAHVAEAGPAAIREPEGVPSPARPRDTGAHALR